MCKRTGIYHTVCINKWTMIKSYFKKTNHIKMCHIACLSCWLLHLYVDRDNSSFLAESNNAQDPFFPLSFKIEGFFGLKFSLRSITPA